MVQVAFATSDGQNVDRHFGMAERFDLYEIDFEKGTSRFHRTILTEKACQNHEHHAGGIARTAEMLEGCVAVVSAAAGPGAVAELNRHLIRSIEAEKPVEQVIQDFLKNKALETEYW